MKHTIKLATLLVMTLVIGCRKESEPPIPEENKALAMELEVKLEHGPYRLISYTTETPYDYDPTDSIGAETNHWRYVSWWLKDDEVFFNNDGTLSISQMENRIPSDPNDVVSGVDWKVTPEQKGVELRFLDFNYKPLVYRLDKINGKEVVVRAKYNGQDVISVFKQLQ